MLGNSPPLQVVEHITADERGIPHPRTRTMRASICRPINAESPRALDSSAPASPKRKPETSPRIRRRARRPRPPAPCGCARAQLAPARRARLAPAQPRRVPHTLPDSANASGGRPCPRARTRPPWRGIAAQSRDEFREQARLADPRRPRHHVTRVAHSAWHSAKLAWKIRARARGPHRAVVADKVRPPGWGPARRTRPLRLPRRTSTARVEQIGVKSSTCMYGLASTLVAGRAEATTTPRRDRWPPRRQAPGEQARPVVTARAPRGTSRFRSRAQRAARRASPWPRHPSARRSAIRPPIAPAEYPAAPDSRRAT